MQNLINLRGDFSAQSSLREVYDAIRREESRLIILMSNPNNEKSTLVSAKFENTSLGSMEF